jgi:hypothetical protein
MPGTYDTDDNPVLNYVTVAELGLAAPGSPGGTATTSYPIRCYSDRLEPIAEAYANIQDWMVPYPLSVSQITAKLTQAAASGTFTVDVKRNGSTVFSTPLYFDAGEETTITAAVQSSLSDVDWNQGDIITIAVTDEADGTASGLEVYITTGAAAVDSEAPTAPANLVDSNPTDNSIDLDWDAASDSIGVTGYRVQRATNAGFTTGVVSFNISNVTSHTVTGLSGGTTYYFRVRAKDAAGNEGAWSNTASGTTASPWSPPAQAIYRWRAKDIVGVSNNTDLTTWEDTIGSADFGAGTDAPTYFTNSGDPYVQFDGSDDSMDAAISDLTDYAIVAVYERPTSIEYARLLSSTNRGIEIVQKGTEDKELHQSNTSGTGLERTRSAPPTGFMALYADRVGTDAKLRLNGSETTTGSFDTANTGTTLYLGSHLDVALWSGLKVKEIIIFDDEVTGADFTAMAAYIDTEYGLTL